MEHSPIVFSVIPNRFSPIFWSLYASTLYLQNIRYFKDVTSKLIVDGNIVVYISECMADLQSIQKYIMKSTIVLLLVVFALTANGQKTVNVTSSQDFSCPSGCALTFEAGTFCSTGGCSSTNYTFSTTLFSCNQDYNGTMCQSGICFTVNGQRLMSDSCLRSTQSTTCGNCSQGVSCNSGACATTGSSQNCLDSSCTYDKATLSYGSCARDMFGFSSGCCKTYTFTNVSSGSNVGICTTSTILSQQMFTNYFNSGMIQMSRFVLLAIIALFLGSNL